MTSTFIEFDNVAKRFTTPRETVTALQDVSTTISEGEFVAVVGPSGCGKSTLLLALAGLTQPSEGAVKIDGSAVTEPVKDLGIIFQQAELLPWRTAFDNIMLQAEIRGLNIAESRQTARELLARVGLAGFENHYPDELSGGMAQRVSLCRALLHDPGILVMDEPFGALDALTRDQTQLDLQRVWLQRRKTVFFITHSIDEAVFLADRVLVFTPRPGRIAEEIAIPLERPRSLAIRSTTEFNDLVGHIRQTFTNLGVYDEEQAA